MRSALWGDFLTTRAWHGAVIGGKDLILRNTSALEHLELFVGYLNETLIDVYAKQSGECESVHYHIVDSFDRIDFIRFGDVLCTSANQTFNDMLSDYDNIDEKALVMGLSNYYYSHRKSFDGLLIAPENMDRFLSIKDWAIEYYYEW
jgi:hypothetical protein